MLNAQPMKFFPLRRLAYVLGGWLLLAIILYARTVADGRPIIWVVQDASEYAIWALIALFLYPVVAATPFRLMAWLKLLPVLVLTWHLGGALAHTTRDVVHQSVVHDASRQRSAGAVLRHELPRQLFGSQFKHLADFTGLLAICIIIALIRNTRARELEHSKLTSQLADARLNALKAQMQPHFLFNTLNTVATLVTTDSKRAIEVLAHLSELLRHAATSEEGHFTTIKEEFDLTRKYVSIMQHRFGDRVTVNIACDEEIAPALVPMLTLQPLVENAYQHGVGPRSEGGTIDIKGERLGEGVRITVCDDGLGKQAGGSASGQRVALKNIEDRLAQLYEEGGTLSLEYGEEDGCCAVITIPFLLSEAG